MIAALDRRWCLEQALSRHPADDGAALGLAIRLAAFLDGAAIPEPTTTVRISQPVGEGAAELSSRDVGASPARPHPSDAVNLPTVAAPASPPGRESNAGCPGAPASDGASSAKPIAPTVRKRRPARTDLPLTEWQRGVLGALIGAAPVGQNIPEATARKATGIAKQGAAAFQLALLANKGYLVSSNSPTGARQWRVIRNLLGETVAPSIDGARIEHRADLPVPVTVLPPRWARGSVQTQFER